MNYLIGDVKRDAYAPVTRHSRCSVPAYFTALIDDAYPIYWCPCHCTGRSSFAAVLTNANFSVAT